MNKRDARICKLSNALRREKLMSIRDAAKLLGVSEMTVRRDLPEMQGRGIIRNMNGLLVHEEQGGTVHDGRAYDLLNESTIQRDAKERIGKFAASLIRPQEYVIFDTGSTTERIIPYISEELEFGCLCFNLNTVNLLSRSAHADIALAGGYYRPKTQMFSSEEGVHFIEGIRANTAFVSAAGIHEKLGISCANRYEVPVKRAMLHSAKQHILVADSSKFGVVRSAHFCDFADIDAIVTDRGLSEAWTSYIESRGISLYKV